MTSLIPSLVTPLRPHSNIILTATQQRRKQAWRCRHYHDYVKGQMDSGHTYKVNLNSRKVVGVVSSRGSREYQEDRTSVHTLSLSPKELQLSLEKHNVHWNPGIVPGKGEKAGVNSEPPKEEGASKAGGGSGGTINELAGQVGYIGIFDGHGGTHVSDHVHNRLHGMIEEVERSGIDDTIAFMRRIGGYFKRFRGGALREWVGHPDHRDILTIEERLTLAFLTADQMLLSREDTVRCGSTASIALFHSLDDAVQPFFSAKKLSLTTAHLGDTTILLCNKHTGKVEPLTERHHADARVEASRLRRLGGGLVTDSFGESRWMGAVENTRSFGDGEFKPLGVTAEPEVKHRIIDGTDYAYMIFVTDGISSKMSNQEIVDLARNAHDPHRAATTIVNFAEDLGSQDNCTCIVVPLAGWGKVGGADETESRREYRRSKTSALSTRMQRM